MKALSRWNQLLALLSVGCFTAGCGPTLAPTYVAKLEQAESAKERGDYPGCALAYQAAAAATDTLADVSEAQYRAATCAARANDETTAISLLQHLAAKPGPRQARAAYDLAFLRAERDGASGELRSALLRFPNAGPARRALQLLIELEGKQRGAKAAEQQLAELLLAVRGSELEESALFERAKLLERADDQKAALSQLEELRQRFPYPAGRYWDEAYLRSASILLRIGDPTAAAKNLEAMLSFREQASGTGSYERSYARAEFQLAEIYATTGQTDKAYAAYLRLPQEFPTSVLRDNAAWRAARLAQTRADKAGACAAAALLLSSEPESVYAPCLSHVCGDYRPNSDCHHYLLK